MGEVGLDDCRPNGGADGDSIQHHVLKYKALIMQHSQDEY